MYNRDLEINGTTYGMSDAAMVSANHWKDEIDRLYKYIEECPLLNDKSKKAFEEEHVEWEKYRSLHEKALGEINAIPEGTMWMISSSQSVQMFRRNKAILLQQELGDVISYLTPTD
jgi:hypothetical protein